MSNHNNCPVSYTHLDEYVDMLTNLSHDEDYPTFATNLVYMAKVKYNKFIKREILYSILDLSLIHIWTKCKCVNPASTNICTLNTIVISDVLSNICVLTSSCSTNLSTNASINLSLIHIYLDKIAPIHVVNLNHTQYSSRYDAFLAGDIQPAFDPKKDGGALMDLGIYNLHIIIKLFGKPESINYFPTMQKNIDTSGILDVYKRQLYLSLNF